ncbi:ubiquitin-binding protein cue5 [Maudiozyma exigua]|uniref:Ubiquitin-binding protein cue5 n=1 Tax=Maudiozyma exigua TaxID=34358 RepID=A0A9P7BBC6_MAUEX|nr:ubiquitin-binding protein cue5 [Kazachstania exigua]
MSKMSEELKDTKVSDTKTTVDKTDEAGTIEKKEESRNVEDIPTGGITMNEEIDSDEKYDDDEANKANDNETKEDSTKSKPTETKSDEIKVVAPEPATLDDITTDEPNNDDNDDAPPLPTRNKTVELEGKSEGQAEAESKPKENPLLKQLQDAFPSIEEKYIRAIIIASKGSMDPAFNALLYLSDPKSGADIPLPSKQPSPSPNLPSRKKLTQLEQDELLAKQLNDQYNNNYKRNSQRRKGSSTTTASSRLGRRTTDENINEPIPFDSTNNRDKQLHVERLSERRRRLKENGEFNPDSYQDDDDSWGQFVEKDLPEITARANKSLQDTASRVGNWFNRNFGSDEQQQQQQQQQQSQMYNNNNSNANAFGYNDEQMREQEEALRFYENQRNQPSSVKMSSTNNDSQNERRRFNSFGQRIGEDSLENHGISLNNDEFSDDEDVPPQLPTRERTREGNDSSNENGSADSADPDASMVTHDSQRVVSQTTYIDTPDKTPKKKWQPVPPEPIDATPTKVNATTNKSTDPDADDFMINSDDE